MVNAHNECSTHALPPGPDNGVFPFLSVVPQHVGAESGDGDGSPVFVKVMSSKDRWNRAGWCFETLCGKNGRGSVPVLERTSSPLREVRACVSFVR